MNYAQLGPKERGWSRRRREGSIVSTRTLARYELVCLQLEEKCDVTTDAYKGDVLQQYKCNGGDGLSPHAQTNVNSPAVGRGKRCKTSKNYENDSYNTKKLMDMPVDRRRGASVG